MKYKGFELYTDGNKVVAILDDNDKKNELDLLVEEGWMARPVRKLTEKQLDSMVTYNDLSPREIVDLELEQEDSKNTSAIVLYIGK